MSNKAARVTLDTHVIKSLLNLDHDRFNIIAMTIKEGWFVDILQLIITGDGLSDDFIIKNAGDKVKKGIVISKREFVEATVVLSETLDGKLS